MIIVSRHTCISLNSQDIVVVLTSAGNHPQDNVLPSRPCMALMGKVLSEQQSDSTVEVYMYASVIIHVASI